MREMQSESTMVRPDIATAGPILNRSTIPSANPSNTPSPKPAANKDLTVFADRFEVRRAESREERNLCFELRHQVYCVEREFEEKSDFPDGRESDLFDRHSIHVLLIDRTSGEALGTARLVLPHPTLGHPINSVAPGMAERGGVLPPMRTGEISRFCLSKTIRKSLGRDTASFLPFLPLGLIQGVITAIYEHRLTHVCAVMEPALLRLLTRLGIHFNPWGELVDHHGLRQPCWSNFDVLMDRMFDERADVHHYCTTGARAAGVLPEAVARLRPSRSAVAFASC